MSMNAGRTVVVATDDGLHVFDFGGVSSRDGRRAEELAGRGIRALEPGGGGPWALVDGKELWRSSDGRWSRVASAGRREAGLHAHYCRAVALAGDTVILSASAGHHGRRAALYRRPLQGRGAFERCAVGLPEWFSDNVDTGCVAARATTRWPSARRTDACSCPATAAAGGSPSPRG